MAARAGQILVLALVCLSLAIRHTASAETIPLVSILPKIEAIHEDAKSLLIKNVELKNQILAGYQAQNDEKIKSVKEGKPLSLSNKQSDRPQTLEQAAHSSMAKQQKIHASLAGATMPSSIDFSELEDFNKWVEVNLEYAVKNTKATAEALKDEAQLNNGNVEYTEQAVNDGIEGVKYWQSAVIFQDKTLKNEKFEQQLD